MNRFYSVPFKTLAVLLSFVCLVIAVFGCVGAVVMYYDVGIYTHSAAEVYNNLASNIIRNDAVTILTDIAEESDMPNYYRYGVRFEVTNSYGDVIYNDLNDYDYDISYSAEIKAGSWVWTEQYYVNEVERDSDLEQYLAIQENVEYVEETYYDSSYEEAYYQVYHNYPKTDVIVTAYLISGEAWGDYNILCRGIPLAYALKYWIFPIIAISIVIFIFLLVFLMCSAGHKKGQEGISKNTLDRVPFDIHTVVVAVILFLFIEMIVEIQYEWLLAVAIGVVLAFTGYLLLISYLMSAAVRFKCGDIFKKTLIYMAFAWIIKGLRKLFKMIGYIFMKMPIIWRAVLVITALAVYNFITVSLYAPSYRIVMWLIETVILLPLTLLVVISLRKIQNGGHEISRGNLDYQIDTKYMTESLKTFSDDLNSIGEGLSKAVDERMKSERFKTELITNVSHDIKTPLTSIINYVDLIKKEEPENETMKQYIEVLDRQSSRLKKLIEDLVEASKASTGNVSVTLEKCDVGVIIAQTAGEYDEKLKSNRLELLINIPDEPCIIMADGRHLWRVMDNLMNNICKYAQPDTRVYINIEKSNGRVAIVFRNISKYALNLTSDEFLERFTRGDSSRSTEGSGLGLSIANSLTELQGGNLSLTVDGDLFKVTLSFDAI